jgi:DNA mismatch repair protein MSH4
MPTKLDFAYMEQSVNNVLMLKTFVDSIKPVWQALVGALSAELQQIHQLCAPQNYVEVENLINYAINEDVGYAKKGNELRNQRVYSIRAGTNGFLDVARQAYKEINDDVQKFVEDFGSKQHPQ